MKQEFEQFRNLVYEMMDRHYYDEAKTLLFIELEKQKEADFKDPIFIAEIAGFLIDIGAENIDAEAAEVGTHILEKNADLFRVMMTEESFFYNLGNAKESLYKVRKYGSGLPVPDRIKPELIEAKNYLYRAFKRVETSNIEFGLKIKSNLAGNLGQAGRVIDAIRYYQEILLIDSEFPQALIGLAENLEYWSLIASYTGTKALSTVIYQTYKEGISKANLPPVYWDKITQVFDKHMGQLKEWGMNDHILKEEFNEARKEYEAHDPFLKFCLDNFLVLNEHAIYCKCNAASKDNLSIGRNSAAFIGEMLPKLELLLNRLKSEFVFSRQLYYEATQTHVSGDVVYYDMGDGEVISKQSEYLRTAFRTCFGIFDKIAHGICLFYNLKQRVGERIYFNTIFDIPDKWEKIKNIANPHLTAIYSIASDFNREDGEFAFYRQWRNALEHNLLILTDKNSDNDPLKIFSEPDFVQKVSYIYFQEQALHLLQLCRSAIFSFAYCIRMETIRPLLPGSKASHIITPKNI